MISSLIPDAWSVSQHNMGHLWCVCFTWIPAGCRGQDVQGKQSLQLWHQQLHGIDEVQVRIFEFLLFPSSLFTSNCFHQLCLLWRFSVVIPRWTRRHQKYRICPGLVQSPFIVSYCSHWLLWISEKSLITVICDSTVQRRHYAAAVNKMMEKNQYRVEVRRPASWSVRSWSQALITSMCLWVFAAAPVHLWSGREGSEERQGLCGAPEAAGPDGPSVGSEHDAGGARGKPAAQWHWDEGKQQVWSSDAVKSVLQEARLLYTNVVFWASCHFCCLDWGLLEAEVPRQIVVCLILVLSYGFQMT